MYACVSEVEWISAPATGRAPDLADDGPKVQIHAVSLGPPLDTMAICGWRYLPAGLTVARDWMLTRPAERCPDCADSLGEQSSSRTIGRLPAQRT
jgi:hypothetical protein